MTAKQKAAREKFKKVVAEAGKLRKKNPSLTQAQAVKQAWAISYSKEGESKKVGAFKKDSSASFYKQQKAFEKQKKVNDAVNKKFANWEYPVPPVYTGNWTIKTWSDYITKNGKKIGLIKKSATKKETTKVKAKKGKTTEQHTDTKSHNVNIRVVSGMNYNDPKYLFNELMFWQNQLDKLRAEYRSPERKMYKKSIMEDIKLSKKWIDNYKKKIRLHLNKVV